MKEKNLEDVIILILIMQSKMVAKDSTKVYNLPKC